jgi:nucleotide-binding universal stress UspA family protein
MKLLLPIDLSSPLDSLVEDLLRMLPLRKYDVHLLFVKEELPSYEVILAATGDFKDDYNHLLESKAKERFAQAEKLLSGHCAKVSSEIAIGPAAMMIETVAKDEGYNLTVMAPGTKAKVEKFLLGSCTNKVLKHGHGTIVVTRGINADIAGPLNILFAVDGSKTSIEAMKAINEQFDLANRNVKVTLCHVVSIADIVSLVSPIEFISIVENNMLLEGETILADAQKALFDLGIKNVDCIQKEGDPSSEILALAKEKSADLIVVGARGRSDIERFLLGSVSHRVASYAHCSCAIVRN